MTTYARPGSRPKRRGFAPNNTLLLARVPGLSRAMQQLSGAVLVPGRVGLELKYLAAHVSAMSAGSRFSAAHTANFAHTLAGTPVEKIAALHEFETSDRFSDAERGVETRPRRRPSTERGRGRACGRAGSSLRRRPDHGDRRGDCPLRLLLPVERHLGDSSGAGAARLRRSTPRNRGMGCRAAPTGAERIGGDVIDARRYLGVCFGASGSTHLRPGAGRPRDRHRVAGDPGGAGGDRRTGTRRSGCSAPRRAGAAIRDGRRGIRRPRDCRTRNSRPRWPRRQPLGAPIPRDAHDFASTSISTSRCRRARPSARPQPTSGRTRTATSATGSRNAPRLVFLVGPEILRARRSGATTLAVVTSAGVLNTWGRKASSTGAAATISRRSVCNSTTTSPAGWPRPTSSSSVESIRENRRRSDGRTSRRGSRLRRRCSRRWQQCCRAPHVIVFPVLRERLVAATNWGYESTSALAAPTALTRHYAAAVGPTGLVAADPGRAGFFVARTLPTEAPWSVHVPADRNVEGAAVAACLVAKLRSPNRRCVAVVDGPPAPLAQELLDLAATTRSRGCRRVVGRRRRAGTAADQSSDIARSVLSWDNEVRRVHVDWSQIAVSRRQPGRSLRGPIEPRVKTIERRCPRALSTLRQPDHAASDGALVALRLDCGTE